MTKDITLYCKAREEKLIDVNLALHEILKLKNIPELDIQSIARDLKDKRLFYIKTDKKMVRKIKKILQDDFIISIYKEKILIVESVMDWLDMA